MDTASPLNEIVLPQPVVGPLTRAAIFLVLCIRPEPGNYAILRSFFADLAGLVRAVEFRDVEAGLLDFSRAVTGSLFFVPSATFLDDITTDGPASTAIDTSPTSETSDPPSSSGRETSLRIGSLKREKNE
jgi:hypothetical protein